MGVANVYVEYRLERSHDDSELKSKFIPTLSVRHESRTLARALQSISAGDPRDLSKYQLRAFNG